MIEPPSVPVRRTALVTMRSSTSSGSRVELTASPTSRRASSCCTLLASSAPRDSSDRIRSTWRSATAAWAAKSSSIRISWSLNGATALRHIERTPTTSSPSNIGAARSVRYPASRWRSCRPYSASPSTSAICWVRMSSTTRPTRLVRPRSTGWSATYRRYASGVASELRESWNTSSSTQEELSGVRAAQAGGAIDDLVEDLRRVRAPLARGPAGSPRWRPPARARRSAPGRGLSLPLRPPGSAWSLRPLLPPARLS